MGDRRDDPLEDRDWWKQHDKAAEQRAADLRHEAEQRDRNARKAMDALRRGDHTMAGLWMGHTAGDPYPASKRFELQNLRFYATLGPERPTVSERRYATSFSRLFTRFVFFRLDIRNPWQHIGSDLDIIVRYYAPDKSLMWQHEASIWVRSDWGDFSHDSGYGSVEAGMWSPGTYRVEVLLDGVRQSREGWFTISDAVFPQLSNPQPS